MKKYFLLLVFFSLLCGSGYVFFFAKEKRALLVTGCARSGTRYVAEALQMAGMHVRHQRMGAEGISTWDLATNPKKGRWKRYSLNKYQFDHIFHQVRDPLKVISSVYYTEDERSWKYIRSQIPEIKEEDPHLVKCSKYWYYWNLRAEELAEWTYRLEDLDQLWGEFATRVGKSIDPSLIDVPKDLNTVKKGDERSFTWNDLKRELDPGLLDKVQTLAQKYGYPTPQD